MNKTTLKFELDLDFVLVAITAPLRDYRLCFKLNKELNIDFSRIEDLELSFSEEEEPTYFSCYLYQQSQTETEFFLLSNKGTDGFLVPEMKQTDFFILIRNYLDKKDLKEMIAAINRIPEVLVAAELDPKKLKSKENLIF